MFLADLTQDQKMAFLGLTQMLAMANNVVDEDEAELIRLFKNEMGLEPDTVAPRAELRQMPKIFPRRRERIGMMLELLGLALIDDEFHAAESATLQYLIKTFGYPDELLDVMESWVRRQLALTREAEKLMEDE